MELKKIGQYILDNAPSLLQKIKQFQEAELEKRQVELHSQGYCKEMYHGGVSNGSIQF